MLSESLLPETPLLVPISVLVQGLKMVLGFKEPKAAYQLNEIKV